MFDPALWHRARRYAGLAGKPLTDDALKLYVIANRRCESHGCRGMWDIECPECRNGLELAQMVAKEGQR